MAVNSLQPQIYQGQFGDFTITDGDRAGVKLYRASLAIAASSFAIASGLALWPGLDPSVAGAISPLFWTFAIALGVSLATIHIYLRPLHRALQGFWLVGCLSAIALSIYQPEPLARFVYERPVTLLGVGFIFAALTGIYFKEAFCFNRLETKLLTPLVPILLLGHLGGFLPISVEKVLLGVWAAGFLVFALRKCFQAIPDDIGDKSVFTYLEEQRSGTAA
jgi:uncharacterized integral membrane protein